jgi:hypothetical protein
LVTLASIVKVPPAALPPFLSTPPTPPFAVNNAVAPLNIEVFPPAEASSSNKPLLPPAVPPKPILTVRTSPGVTVNVP